MTWSSRGTKRTRTAASGASSCAIPSSVPPARHARYLSHLEKSKGAILAAALYDWIPGDPSSQAAGRSDLEDNEHRL